MDITLTQNLHTHTPRCHHADGTERDYIENAIAGGLCLFGFSDHSPCAFRGEYYSGFRMAREAQDDYVDVLLSLREEYKDRIDIKIGYEMEYYPALFSDTTKLLTSREIDYVILGQHFTNNETDGFFCGDATEDEGRLALYVDQVIEAVDTGFFTYIAHPDNLNFVGDEKIYVKHYTRLIEHAKKAGIPLEINFLGIRWHRHYPTDKFFRLVGEIGAPVCCGCDAHSPADSADFASFAIAKEMIEKYGLKYIASPELKKPREM